MKKKIPHRDLIAKDMLLSNKFKMKVIPNKKKKTNKFSLEQELKEYDKEKDND